jgi:hypothetical protein
MKLITHLAVAAFASCLAFGAHADNESAEAAKDNAKANYKAAMHEADKYKSDKEHCKTLSGNDKDVCMKQAKADLKKAKADAKAHKTVVKAEANKTEDKMEAQYKVAKEKCDAMSGDAKDACIAQAKQRYQQ